MGSSKFKPDEVMRDEKKVVPINVPERNLTTSQQTQTLLGVCGMFWSMLQGPPQLDEGLPKAGTVQGEARTAAEMTFVKACDALQVILDDKQRWDFTFQASIEHHFREATALNRDFLIAQKHAAEEKASPHFRWQPSLVRLTTGEWAAVLGDIETGIVGVGNNAQEALDAFDAMFRGEISESVKTFLEKHEQNQQLDGTGNQTVEGTKGRGQEPEGNSSEPGPLA